MKQSTVSLSGLERLWAGFGTVQVSLFVHLFSKIIAKNRPINKVKLPRGEDMNRQMLIRHHPQNLCIVFTTTNKNYTLAVEILKPTVS